MNRTARVVWLAAVLTGALGPGCSAVINPDTNQLDPDASGRDASANGNDGSIPGSDTGVGPGTDTGVGPGTDAGVGPGDDAGVGPGDDAGVVATSDAGRDAAVTIADAGRDAAVTTTDGGPMCMPGVECGGYQAVLAAQATGATNLSSCVVQMHRTDCCGARDAYGVNHAARAALCGAEASCLATYPPATCMDNTITTDTGETTTRIQDVRLRLVDPTPCGFDPSVTCYTCETFVCTMDSCRSAPGVNGGCG